MEGAPITQPAKRRVGFRLEANRAFVVQPEQPVAERLRPYKQQRTGERSQVANREVDTTNYHRYARALERAAHDNAIKVTRHDRAEVVMALLGKMRHHPEQRQLWQDTGRDASEEDRAPEADEADRLVEELAEQMRCRAPQHQPATAAEAARLVVGSRVRVETSSSDLRLDQFLKELNAMVQDRCEEERLSFEQIEACLLGNGDLRVVARV